MAKRLQVRLQPEHIAELRQVQRQHAKAYMRERAAAILKVAEGQAVRCVAQSGLLQAREPETVSGWIQRYQAQGLAGLEIRPGRGRKPVFSPPTSRRGRRPSRAG